MQQTSADIKASFSSLLERKGNYLAEDIALLENLLQKHPYSQPLHLLYAAILMEDKPSFEKYLPKAAVSVARREVLFSITHKPATFWTDLTNISSGPANGLADEHASIPVSEVEEIEQTSKDVSKAEEIQQPIEEVGKAEEVEPVNVGEGDFILPEEPDYSSVPREEMLPEPEKIIVEEESEEPTSAEVDIPEAEETPQVRDEQLSDAITDEPFVTQVEAAGVEKFEPQPQKKLAPDEHNIETVIPEFEIPYFFIEEPEAISKTENLPYVQEEENRPEENIFDSIASANYFVFDKSSADPLTNKQAEEAIPEPVQALRSRPEEFAGVEAETTDVSKYHDDKMPFTFLWWLQKTRKEHGINYQPYAGSKISITPTPLKSIPEQLNHQIIENIISQQVAIEEPEFEEQGSEEERRKEPDLIEKFIKEDPQIRPPRFEKLDTENKARKSSEDNLDLVSETLAQIYIDQMLYHKAIDTYKKLSLKYPEKSAYFAGQISELEKKTG